MATSTATAWAGTLGRPATATRSWSRSSPSPKAARETTRKRAAWNLALPAVALNVQCRFHQKLLRHGGQERDGGRHAVVDAERVDAQRVHGQVEDVATGADQPEADQLQPVGSVAEPDPDARGERKPELGRARLLLRHRASLVAEVGPER